MKKFILLLLLLPTFLYSQQVKLGDLNNKSSITGTEKIPVSGSGNPAITANLLRTYLTPFVTPEQFGAVGDGSTNDAAAFNAAFATGLAVHGSNNKNYRLTAAITLPDDAVFIGNGCTISVTSLIDCFSMGNRCIVTTTTFDGNNSGSAGIRTTGSKNKISNCYFVEFAAAGLFAQGGGGSPNFDGGSQVENCYFENNTGWGVRCFTSNAEYNNFSNCTARNNGSGGATGGVSFESGNNNWTGGKITLNTIGFRLASSANSGHSTIVGTGINHNTTNISIASEVNGFEIVACDIILGNIIITNSEEINIRNSRIDGAGVTITLTNNVNCNWSGNTFVTTPTFTITGTGDKFTDNTFVNTIPASITNTIRGINRATVSTQFDKTSSTTLSDVTGLTTTVRAGGKYTFEATLYTTSNVAGGVKAAIAGTATATAIIYEAVTYQGGTLATVGTTRSTALATAAGDVTAVTTARIEIRGTITVNAAGTLTVQFAQNASNASASSVLVGSSWVVNETF